MPAAHHDHGFWYVVRLSHLGPADFIRFRCHPCGAWQAVAPWQLHYRFHPEALLAMIADEVRCPACGAIGRNNWMMWRAHPGPEVGPPDADEVKWWFKEYEKR